MKKGIEHYRLQPYRKYDQGLTWLWIAISVIGLTMMAICKAMLDGLHNNFY